MLVFALLAIFIEDGLVRKSSWHVDGVVKIIGCICW